jgi:hypothetical protein
MRLLPIALIACCAGLACPGVRAQGVASDPRAKKAVDDAVAALGGPRFLGMRDRVESGRAYSFYRDKISGLSIATIYTQYFAVPADKSSQVLGVREREVFGKDEEYGYVLFREQGAWEVTFKGPTVLDQDRIDTYRRTTFNDILYFLRMRLSEPGLIFDWKGSDVIENQPVNMVDITDSENRVITVNFNQDTKLPVKETWVWRDPKTHERNDEVTRYAIYRDDSGIQWPQQITRERNGEKKYQIFSESVLIDQNLPDAVFEKPSGPATKTPWKAPKKKK